MDFDFKNWDFVDPNIISKFQHISEVSQMLSDQQKKLKQNDFLLFKDRLKVQGNITKLENSLLSLVRNQKDHLVNYFDKQLDFVSKQVNVPQLSRTFQQSLCSRNSSVSLNNTVPIPTRRYSENDISCYLSQKEKLLSNSRGTTGKMIFTRNILDTVNNIETTEREGLHSHNRLLNSDRGMSMDLKELDGNKDGKRTGSYTGRRDSIFSQNLQNCETYDESQWNNRKIRELQEELSRVNGEAAFFRRFYRMTKQKQIERRQRGKRERPARKNFARDRKKRISGIERDRRQEVRKTEEEVNRDEEGVERLMVELEKAREKNDIFRKGMKELSYIVVKNEQMIEEILREKKEINKEFMVTKELNAILVENFSKFKAYVEKTLAGISNKLMMYVEKEEVYMEIEKENQQLKQKCKALLGKLKEVTNY